MEIEIYLILSYAALQLQSELWYDSFLLHKKHSNNK